MGQKQVFEVLLLLRVSVDDLSVMEAEQRPLHEGLKDMSVEQTAHFKPDLLTK